MVGKRTFLLITFCCVACFCVVVVGTSQASPLTFLLDQCSADVNKQETCSIDLWNNFEKRRYEGKLTITSGTEDKINFQVGSLTNNKHRQWQINESFFHSGISNLCFEIIPLTTKELNKGSFAPSMQFIYHHPRSQKKGKILNKWIASSVDFLLSFFSAYKEEYYGPSLMTGTLLSSKYGAHGEAYKKTVSQSSQSSVSTIMLVGIIFGIIGSIAAIITAIIAIIRLVLVWQQTITEMNEP